jgi:hypothetical protein
MTKRGTIAIALTLIAILALSAPSAMAQLSPLRAKQAKRLAKDLGRKQKRENDVIVYHLAHMRRTGTYTFKFDYDERTIHKTYCTATLRVRKRQVGNTIETTATLLRHKCKLVPVDVREVEKATRKANRRVARNEKATLRSLRRTIGPLDGCRAVRNVPRKRKRAVAAIVDSALVGALRRPNDDALDAFVAALGRVDPGNRTLAAGVEGWADFLDVMRSLQVFRDPCGTIKAWKNAGWAGSESPIDMTAYRTLSRRSTTDLKAITRAAAYMERKGAFDKLVVGFTPDGLLLKYGEV